MKPVLTITNNFKYLETSVSGITEEFGKSLLSSPFFPAHKTCHRPEELK